MLYWSKSYPENRKSVGLNRLRKACQNYFMVFDEEGKHQPGKSYRERLMALHNVHHGKRCFVMGNGPSLARMNLSLLKEEITIGSNGIFKKFSEIGFPTTYFTMEDTEQVEDREDELASISGTTRFFALYNAHCIPARDDTLFLNIERTSHGEGHQGKRWKHLYPQFSLDLASAVYLGATITYINIQLAFFLGCDPIYLIGVDHNYGAITKKYKSGKIDIDDKVMDELQNSHFISDYHSVGGRFGVPYTEQQEMAYAHSYFVVKSFGRNIFNAGYDSHLEIFPKVSFDSLF